ncbi:hypothetical protein KKC88_02390 [Patescibacteria group bacterium]|nr:hypothetical protein [Patescibacteria group bacterium]MBU1672951.1 hypothetical protein [Patescibacteria group bacterium]
MASPWQCPKCARKFKNKNQAHSCRKFPLKNHFIGKKDIAEPLFDDLTKKIKKEIGPFKIQSLECCIHLDRISSFGAVYALKDGIRIHFASNKPIASPRINKSSKISAQNYMHSLDIHKKSEINKQLINWLKLAYNLKE